MSVIHSWGSTPSERAEAQPCDQFVAAPRRELFRAVDVAAPVPDTFRWLCQLRVAPYSYDWIDNFGRRSPRRRDPRNEVLAVGQRFMTIFRLADFEPDRQLTLVLMSATSIFGELAVTYAARPATCGSRIVVKLVMRSPGLAPSVLAFGDFIMMRKQLLTLKRFAEAEQVGVQRFAANRAR
jgi:hypothetical protein